MAQSPTEEVEGAGVGKEHQEPHGTPFPSFGALSRGQEIAPQFLSYNGRQSPPRVNSVRARYIVVTRVNSKVRQTWV